MNNIFNEKEQEARRQFFRLFCTDLLHRCLPTKAIHADPWNADILWDILRNVHEDNPLVPSDIETIIQICGMADKSGYLWFTYDNPTPMFPELLAACSPYMTSDAYSKSKLALVGKDSSSSVYQFFNTCCRSSFAKITRVAHADLYRMYTEWCYQHKLAPTTPRAFRNDLVFQGVKAKKGYVDGKSGCAYYLVALDLRDEVWNSEPQRTEESRAQAAKEQDVAWRRNEARPVAPRRTKEKVPVLQEPENPVAECEGDFGHDEEPDVENDWGYEEDRDVDGTSEVLNPEDGDDGRDNPLSEDRHDSTEKSCGDQSEPEPKRYYAKGDSVKERVKALDPAIRRFFKLMKITYRVNPDNFKFQDFQKYARMEGIFYSDDKALEDLFRLFVDYAEVKQEG